MMPPLDLNLSLEQTFIMAQIQGQIHNLSRAELEQHLLDVTRQSMIYKNVMTSLIKVNSMVDKANAHS